MKKIVQWLDARADQFDNWFRRLVAAHRYTPKHHRNRFETKYRKPGAVHYGNWYDEDTALWPVVAAR